MYKYLKPTKASSMYDSRLVFGIIFLMATLTLGCHSGDKSKNPKEDKRPKCDNCQPYVTTISECHHWADARDGTPCSITECIENKINTASCEHHATRTGNPNCDNERTLQAAVFQIIRTTDCPQKVVKWQTLKDIYAGCNEDCDLVSRYRVACLIESCTGKIARRKPGRGIRYKCGCK